MSSKQISFVLWLICITLLVILVWPDDDIGFDSGNTIQAISSVQNQPAVQELSQISYAAIVQKPLFDPSRIGSLSETTANSKVLSFKQRRTASASLPGLLGVMQIGNIYTAFVEDNVDTKSIMLREGDRYQDWELVSISATEIVLRKDNVDENISLDWGVREIVSTELNSDMRLPAMRANSEKVGAGNIVGDADTDVNDPIKGHVDMVGSSADDSDSSSDENYAGKTSVTRSSNVQSEDVKYRTDGSWAGE